MSPRQVLFVAGVFALGLSRADAGELPAEGSVRGFPVLRDRSGRKLADGDFYQWLEQGALHVRTRYDFGNGHWVQEEAAFQHEPQLSQERWSWKEVKGNKTVRHFEVDFKTGAARSEVATERQTKHWSETLKVEPGRTFSGFGFTLAIKSVRERLLRGEKAEFRAIAFSPKPREVSVEISYAGLYRVPMSGRKPEGECYVIHPKIPAVAKIFVTVPDTRIWLTHPGPAEFLRWEGPFAEPDDPMVRVDVLAGDPSGPAEPVVGGK
jgi:hypothetical protein